MRFGKTGGAVAALALVSVFVFGGVEVAHADGYLTMAAFDSTGATNPTLVLHGTAAPGAPITVTATSTEATDAAYCQTTADPGGSWYCTKDNSPAVAHVQFGSNVFTATDGTSTVSSTPITIYGTDGPSLTSPHAGSSVLPYYPVFFGYGPARGSIDVIANSGGTVCTVATVPDSGQWSCFSQATLTVGTNGFTVRSTTPGYPSVGYDSRDSNPTPVTVAALTAPAVSYVMGYATGSSTATISFENGAVGTDLYSITEPSGEGNGYVSSPYPNPSCGPILAPGPLVCNFGNLAPGIWKAHSYQYLGEMIPVGRNDFFRIPEAPTMTATAQPDQTVAFSGTGTTGDLVSVIATGGTDGGTTVCTATVVVGVWSCTAAATPGSHSYHASQLDQGWTPYRDSDSSGNVDGAPLGIVLDGRSALTATDTVIVAAPATPPAAPTMSYVMGYATGSSTATGPEGTLVHTELYSVTEPEGDGSGYSFDSPVLSCSSDSEGSTTAADASSTVQPCDFGTLAPGIWNVYSWQTVGTLDSPYQNDFFRVPTAPTMTTTGNADQTVSFSGTGTTGDLVSVIDETGGAVCSGTVVAGAWSCTATATPGSNSYRAYQLDQGWTPYTDDSGNIGNAPLGVVLNGKSALTAPVTTSVPAASIPAVPTPTTPPAAQGILNWLLTITGMNGPLRVGDTVTLSSSGLPAGSTVSLFMHSTPVSLGNAIVAKNGTFSKTVTIPEGVEPGDHHFVATITVPGNAPSTVESPVTIAAPEELSTLSVPPTPDPTPAPAEAAGGNSHGKTAHIAVAPRNEPAAPSSFSNALPTLSALIDNPGALAVAVGLALAIMLLVAIPTELLNSTITSNLDRFGSFFTRAEGVIEKAGGWLTRVTRTQATASVILILISSIIFGFADPHYGFDLVSLRLTLSLAIAMFIVYYLASLISGRIAKARWGVESEISMQPIALVFAIVGVVLGRLLGFSPGFLIGLALGLELAATAKSAHRAKALILRTSIIVGLALVAWLGYSLIQLWSAGGQETFWTGLVQDTLVSVTAEGLTGMVLALLPLSFMEGKELWDHSKLLWVGLFLFTGTAFSLLVLPTAMQGGVVGNNLAVWLLVLACFTAVTLALWSYLRFSRGKAAEDERERDEARVEAKVEA